MTNQDGIQIPFGSSDIKALLTYFLAEYETTDSEAKFIANRCNYDIRSEETHQYENTTQCADINAGSFHVLLSNQLGLRNEGFIMDRDRGADVWNQPIAGFRSKIIGDDVNNGNATKIHLLTSVTYAKETSPTWNAHEPYLVEEDYEYWLEIDQEQNIVGGSFETWERADFEWKLHPIAFNGYFEMLAKIYSSSINETYETALFEKGLKPARLNERNHHYLNETEGTFETTSTSTEMADTYPNNYFISWTLYPPQQTTNAIIIRLEMFSTERYRDKLRIYEGSNGEGALVAVLHGERPLNEEIRINAPSARIIFTSDDIQTGKGFRAHYRAVQ